MEDLILQLLGLVLFGGGAFGLGRLTAPSPLADYRPATGILHTPGEDIALRPPGLGSR